MQPYTVRLLLSVLAYAAAVFLTPLGSTLWAQDATCGENRIWYVTADAPGPPGNLANGEYGSPRNPATIQHAFANAEGTPLSPAVVRIAGGSLTYTINSKLVVARNHVQFEGGWSPNLTTGIWQKDNALETRIIRTAANLEQNPNRIVAIEVIGRTNVRFQDITVLVQDAPPSPGTDFTAVTTAASSSIHEGVSLYGIYLNGVNNYQIVRCLVRTGNATNGRAGRNGNVAGGFGLNNGGGSGSRGIGGNGGGQSGSNGSAGGLGGNGLAGNMANIQNPPPQTGFFNLDGTGGQRQGAGGTAGAGGSNGCGDADGGNGGNASGTAQPGTNGLAATTVGVWYDAWYRPTRGGHGGGGAGGNGGGGGGGGTRDNFFGVFGACLGGGSGGRGADGGLGGRGGHGGEGGYGGGGTFGVFLWNSGTGTNGLILDSRIEVGNVGLGANGGVGENGQAASNTGGSGGGSGGFLGIGAGRPGGAGGTATAGARGGDGARGRDGVRGAVMVQGGSAVPVFQNTNGAPAPVVNADPVYGDLPNNPFTFNMLIREGCTNSEITFTRTDAAAGPRGGWTLNQLGAFVRYDLAGDLAVAYFPAIGRKTMTVNNGTIARSFSDFVDIRTNRPVPAIRAIANGVVNNIQATPIGDPIPRITICANSSINFEGVDVGPRFNNTQWEWTFPGNASVPPASNVPLPVRQSQAPGDITFNTPGSDTITLRAFNQCCGWSRPIQMIVEVLPIPQVTLAGATEVCIGFPASFVATPTTPLTLDPNPEFQWSLVDALGATTVLQAWTPLLNSPPGNEFDYVSFDPNGYTLQVQIRSRAPFFCTNGGPGFSSTNPLSIARISTTISQPSNAGFAYIDPNPIITIDSICPGETITARLLGQSPNGRVQWQHSFNGTTGWVDLGPPNNFPVLTTLPLSPTTRNFFRARVTNGGCPPATSNIVEARFFPGAIGGTATVDAATDTICIGQSSNISLAGYDGMIEWQFTTTPNIPSSWTSTLESAANVTFFNLQQTTWYRARLTKPGNCGTTFSNVVRVTVIPAAVAGNIVPDATPVCAGQSVLLRLDSYSGDAVQWQRLDAIAGWVNEGPNADVYLTSGLSATTSFRALVSRDGCPPVATAPVTIGLLPGSTSSVTLVAPKTTICQGESITFTTLVGGSPSGPSFEWLINGVVTASGASYTTTNIQNNDTLQVRMTVGGGCGGGTFISNRVVMRVQVTPTVTITASSGPYCLGDAITFTAVETPAGSSVFWLTDGAPNGFTGNTFTTTTLTSGQTITARAFTAAGCTSAVSNAIPVVLNPLPTANITSTSTTICQGQSVTFNATVANGGATPSYQWQLNSGLGFTDIPGANGQSYTTSILNDGDVIRVRAASDQGCSGPTSNSNPITMTVGGSPTAVIAANTTSICQGQSVTFTVTGTTNAGANPSYQWRINGANVGGNTDTYTTNQLNNGDVVTVRITSASGCTSPSSISNGIAITVSPIPVASLNVSQNPTCVGQSVTFIAASPNAGGGATYTFFVNNFPVQTGTDPSYSTSTLNNGDEVYFTVQTALGCSGTPSTSNRITMSIQPNPTVSLSASATSICLGQNVTFTATSVGGGASPTFEFYLNRGGVLTMVQTGTSTLYSTNTLQNGDSIQVRIISGLGCTTPASFSNIISISVNPEPTVSVTTSPSTTICAGQSVTFTANPSNAGPAPTYQWFRNGVFAQTGPTFVTANLANGDVIEVRVTSTAGCTGPGSTSAPVIMTVNPQATVSIAPTTSNQVCTGGSITYTATASNLPAGSTFDWRVNSTVVQSGTSGSFTVSNPNNGDIVDLIVTPSNGCVLIQTNTQQITVFPNPSVSISASKTNICPGEAVTFTASASNTGGNPTFQWLVNGAAAPGGTNSIIYSTGNLNDGDEVSVSVTSAQGCSGPGSLSNLITITVSPVPTVTVTASPSTTICQGQSVTFTANAVDAGALPQFRWFRNGSQVSTSATYTSSALQDGDVVFVTVTSQAGCTGAASSSTPLTMTVTPTSQVSIAATSTNAICAGGSVTYLATVTNPSAGQQFEWTVNGDVMASGGSPSFIASQRLGGTPLQDGDVVRVRLTPTNGCAPVESNIDRITVYPNPSVSITANTNNVCPGTPITFIANPTNAGSSPIFTWYRVTSAGTQVAPGSSNSAIFTSSTLTNGDSIYVEVVSAQGCSNANSRSNRIGVNINPLPTVTITTSPGTTVCQGTVVTFTANPVNAGTTPSYQWRLNGQLVGSGPAYVNANLNNTDEVTVQVTSSEGCTSPSVSISPPVLMTVTPTPTVTIASNPFPAVICQGENITFTATASTGAGTSYVWQINGVAVAGVTGPVFTTSTISNGQIVTAVATSAGGCSGPQSISNGINVQVQAAPSVSIVPSQNPVCFGTAVIFTPQVFNGGPAPIYRWFRKPAGGAPATLVSTSATFSASNFVNGDTVYVEVASTPTCPPGVSNRVAMQVFDPVTVAIAPLNPTICRDSLMTFTATVGGATGPGLTYTWFVNGGQRAAGPSNTFSLANAANQDEVTVRVSTADGCLSNMSPPALVTVVAPPSVSISPSQVNICPGTTPTFTASPSVGLQYQWYLNNAPVAGATGATFSPSGLTGGPFTITVQAISPVGGCTGPQSFSNPASVNIVQDATISITASDTTFCEGEPITFSASITNGGATPVYQWKINGTNVGTNAPFFTSNMLQDGDEVLCVLTPSSGCPGNAIFSVPIVMNMLPTPTVSVQPSATRICQNDSITFVSSVLVNGLVDPNPTYQWQVNGTPVAGATASIFVASGLPAGTHDVRVVVFSSSGCPFGGLTSQPIIITIDNLPTVTVDVSTTAICRGQEVIFTAIPSATAGSSPTFVWRVNGVVVTGASGAVYVTDSLQPNATVTAQVISSFGCTDALVSLGTAPPVTVSLPPVVDFSSPVSTQCRNINWFDFVSTSTGNHRWEFGPWATPNTSTQQNPTGIRFDSVGTLNVWLIVTDPATGCSDSAMRTVTVLPSPIADFTAPGLLCVQGGVFDFLFTGDTAGMRSSYLWDFGPGAVPQFATVRDPQGVRYSSAGIKDISLIVTSLINGCTDTIVKPIEVGDSIFVDLGPDTLICAADLPGFVLNAGVPGALRYEWFYNGDTIGGANTQTYNPDRGSGIYQVRVSTLAGCIGSDAMRLTVTNGLPVDLGPDIRTCERDTPIVLRSGYPGAAHQWLQDGQLIAGATGDILQVTQSGVYNVVVTLPGSSCPPGSDVIVVNLIPQNSFTIDLGPDLLYCGGDTRQPLDAGFMPGAIYVWYRNGSQTDSTSQTFTPDVAGEYVVTVITRGNCVASDTVQIDVVPTLTVDLGPDLTICPGSPLVQLDAPVVPGALYTWTRNGQVISTALPPLFVVDTGNYVVSIISTSGCQAADQINISFVPQPFAAFETDPIRSPNSNEVRVGAQNPVVRFFNTSLNASTYLWDFGDGTFSTDRDPVHIFPAGGQYIVRLYAYNGTCVDSIISGPITILNIEEVFIPTAFTPNSDGNNDEFYFPTLAFTTFEFLVHDRWGRLVYEKQLGPEAVRWLGKDQDGKDLPSGVYVYRFRGIKHDGREVVESGTITLLR